MQLLVIAAIIVAACSVIFALQNNVPVTVTFLLWRFDSSLAVVLLLALAIGGLVVALVSTPSTLRRQWTASRQNKRIAELEKTCDSQKQTIADLQNRLPAIDPAPAVERSYVGLKHIITGGGDKQRNPPPD